MLLPDSLVQEEIDLPEQDEFMKPFDSSSISSASNTDDDRISCEQIIEEDLTCFSL